MGFEVENTFQNIMGSIYFKPRKTTTKSRLFRQNPTKVQTLAPFAEPILSLYLIL